jgi:hypothetical protein
MSWKNILKYCGKEVEDPWHDAEPPLPAAKDNIENLSDNKIKCPECDAKKGGCKHCNYTGYHESKRRSSFTAKD